MGAAALSVVALLASVIMFKVFSTDEVAVIRSFSLN